MLKLVSFQNNLLEQTTGDWFRYLYNSIESEERLVGLKGLRGVGKTTLLLQYLKFAYPNKKEGLYVTVDHPYFYTNTLFDLATDWRNLGGKLLLIDEVHKYDNWSRELKLIYDGFPELQVIFTSSSALGLYKGESDLSRRLIVQTLEGLSFREYLAFKHKVEIDPISLSDILVNHSDISNELVKKFKPILHFKNYLIDGYFPFAKKRSNYLMQTMQTINTVLETDLAHIQDYSPSNTDKMKKLLGVISETVPFEPNISHIAQKLKLGRNTVANYLHHLQEAKIINFANKKSKGITQLQKPNKIYFENTSFLHALQNNALIGTVRETFFINQLKNANHNISLADKADFLVNDTWTFEVGGKNKNSSQLNGLKNGFLALDDIEHGLANKIPLWLFGLMY